MSSKTPDRPVDLYFDRYASGRNKYTTCPEGGAMYQIPDSDPPYNPNEKGYVPGYPAEIYDMGDG